MRAIIANFRNVKNMLANAALYSGSEESMRMGALHILKTGWRDIAVIVDADAFRTLLVDLEPQSEKSVIYWKPLRAIIGRALGSTEGDEWLRLRQLQKKYFTPQAVGFSFSSLSTSTFGAVKKLGTEADVNLLDFFSQLNTRLLLDLLFGIDVGKDAIEGAADIGRRVADGENYIAWRSRRPWRKIIGPISPAGFRAKAHLKALSTLVAKIIKQREEGKAGGDKLLDGLLAEPSITEKEIRNELIVHLGAGTETAAVAQTWTLYLLMQNRKYLEHIVAQMDELLCGIPADEPISAELLSKMVLLEQALAEALRLYPPSHALVRDTLADVEYEGMKLKKGTILYMSVYGLHRNPKYWVEPDRFYPERFDKASEVGVAQGAYLPFGLGKHNCIGRYMAQPLMMLGLAEILRRFSIENKTYGRVAPLSLSTLKPSKPILVGLKIKNINH